MHPGVHIVIRNVMYTTIPSVEERSYSSNILIASHDTALLPGVHFIIAVCQQRGRRRLCSSLLKVGPCHNRAIVVVFIVYYTSTRCSDKTVMF